VRCWLPMVCDRYIRTSNVMMFAGTLPDPPLVPLCVRQDGKTVRLPLRFAANQPDNNGDSELRLFLNAQVFHLIIFYLL
jgi:hypothetical protein